MSGARRSAWTFPFSLRAGQRGWCGNWHRWRRRRLRNMPDVEPSGDRGGDDSRDALGADPTP
jgi:hypothetical protein